MPEKNYCGTIQKLSLFDMGIRIKDAELVKKVSGKEKIPVSDGSDMPKAVSAGQLKEFANEGMATETYVNEHVKKELEEALEGVGSKDDLMAIELSEEGDVVLTYGEETNLSDGYIREDGELVLEFNYE